MSSLGWTFFKAAEWIKKSGKGFCCSSCCPCHCHCFQRAFVVFRQVLALHLSCVCLVVRWARGACVILSAWHTLSVGFHTLLYTVHCFPPKRSFSPLLISCHLLLLHKWLKENSLLLPPPRTGGSFSATRLLFIRLSWIVNSAKPFKASTACKEYSAVFLSLWISKDKTTIRVKRPLGLVRGWCWTHREGQ